MQSPQTLWTKAIMDSVVLELVLWCKIFFHARQTPACLNEHHTRGRAVRERTLVTASAPQGLVLDQTGAQRVERRAILPLFSICEAATSLPNTWDGTGPSDDVTFAARRFIGGICPAPRERDILKAAQLGTSLCSLARSRGLCWNGIWSRRVWILLLRLPLHALAVIF